MTRLEIKSTQEFKVVPLALTQLALTLTQSYTAEFQRTHSPERDFDGGPAHREAPLRGQHDGRLVERLSMRAEVQLAARALNACGVVRREAEGSGQSPFSHQHTS